MAFDLAGLQSFGTGAIGFTIIAIVIIVLFALTGFGVWLFLKWKKYQQYKCIIWERDGLGNIRQYSDNAGIFVDKKTNNKRFFLQRSNVGLEPDNVPYVIMDNKKLVYLIRRGLKNFQYIKPVISAEGFEFKVTEEDVNWAINAYERQKKIFQENKFMQYLPFILLAFVSIIILIVFIYFFKEFGVLREVAVALRQTAEALVQYKSGVVLS